MKVRKFCFKFLNHDKRECCEIEVTVFSDQMGQWKHHDENNLEAHATWMGRHAKWEKKLKHHVKHWIANHEDLIREGIIERETESKRGEKDGHNFAGYKFHGEETEKKCKIINLNPEGKWTDIEFRQIMLMEKCKIKLVKGQKPENWTDIFTTYTHIQKHFNFYLKSTEMDEKGGEIELISVGQPFKIPPEGGRTENMPSRSRNQAIMGADISVQNMASKARSRDVLGMNQATMGADTSVQNMASKARSQNVLGMNQVVSNQNTITKNIGTMATNMMARPGDALNQSLVGGDDYQNKYLKYKKKYVDLKGGH
jgi:hypothetical protein